MRRKSINIAMIVCLLLGIFGMNIEKLQAEGKKLEIFYFYDNPCASCEVESQFYELFNQQVGDIKGEITYELKLYNTFNTEGRSFFDEVCNAYSIAEDKRQMPLLLVGDSYLIGDSQISKELRNTFVEQSQEFPQSKVQEIDEQENDKQKTNHLKVNSQEEVIEVDPDESHLIYFYTSACEDCQKTKSFLDELDATYDIQATDKEVISKVVVEEKNIAEPQNTELINTYFQTYQIPVEAQKVPIIFYEEGYLAGYEDIESYLAKVIESGQALNFTYPNAQETIEKLKISELPQIFLTGLINGFNPCSISMLLLLLSLMSMGSNILKLGFTYIIGKVVTYLALGTMFYSFLAAVDGMVFQSIQGLINLIIIMIMLILAGTNLLDYLAAKQEKYHKIRLQLPTKLRKFNHQIIQGFMKKSQSKYAVLSVLGLSVIVSAGEFLCTGQIYLATIIYLLKRTVSYDGITFVAFLLYVVAMVLPLCLLIILAYKGHKVLALSEFVRKNMTKIKLMNAVIFILFAVMILCL